MLSLQVTARYWKQLHMQITHIFHGSHSQIVLSQTKSKFSIPSKPNSCSSPHLHRWEPVHLDVHKTFQNSGPSLDIIVYLYGPFHRGVIVILKFQLFFTNRIISLTLLGRQKYTSTAVAPKMPQCYLLWNFLLGPDIFHKLTEAWELL